MRGDGATTRQMQKAPHGATFVWVSPSLSYAVALAIFLGREDLKIVSPGWICERKWRGTRSPVIVDHAFFWQSANVSDKARSMVHEMRDYLDRVGVPK